MKQHLSDCSHACVSANIASFLRPFARYAIRSSYRQMERGGQRPIGEGSGSVSDRKIRLNRDRWPYILFSDTYIWNWVVTPYSVNPRDFASGQSGSRGRSHVRSI